MATQGRNGGEKTGGRQKGSLNKFGASVKESVLNAFMELQKDDQANIVNWGKKNPKEFYIIAAKLIPTEMAVKAEITEIEIKKTVLTKKGE
jgi:hypothetical protein